MSATELGRVPAGLATTEPNPAKSRKARTRISLRLALPPVILLVAVCTVLEILSATKVLNPMAFPAPSSIAQSSWTLLADAFFWESMKITTWETVAGFLIGSAGGFAIGALCGTSSAFNRAVYPWVVVLQNTPRVALAPIFLTWFGFGLSSKIAMAVTICFFPLVINTIVGMASTDPSAKLMMRSLGATRSQMFFRLTLPSAAPVIFAGLKNAMTLALIGAIVGEFVGADIGIGVLIQQYQFKLDVAGGFALVLLLAIAGLILYGVVAWFDRRFIFWQGK